MLNVISLEQAVDLARGELCAARIGTELLPADDAVGRVLSADVVSGENVPAFDRSTMDGFALRAADTFGAGQTLPAMLRIVGEIAMGAAAETAVGPGECAAIPTGGMLPAGADAVVPVEYTEKQGDLCLCYTAVSPLQNVTCAGDDVAAGQTVLKKGTRLSPAGAGVLAAMGRARVEVYKKPRVAILSTGNEIVPADASPRPGQVRDVNSHLLRTLCASYGCECVFCGMIEDRKEPMLSAVKTAAAENDLVLISGGSSAGKADLTADVIAALGTVFCHGVAVKPGKPTVLGAVGQTAVFGLPGHPAACWFMAELLVRSHVEALLGVTRSRFPVRAALSEHVPSNHGREELLCVRLEEGKAIPVYAKSGVISQLCAADGYLVIPRACEGLARGTEVSVTLF